MLANKETGGLKLEKIGDRRATFCVDDTIGRGVATCDGVASVGLVQKPSGPKKMKQARVGGEVKRRN